MEIRSATEQDLNSIHAIYHHYVATSIASLQNDLPTLESMKHNFTNIQAHGMPFLVATDPSNSTVCGYAYGDYFNERSGYNHTVEDSVYIHPDYCGRGIAQTILDAIFRTLKADGKKVVIAKMSILPDAAPESLPSARLHLAMGFKEVGRLLKVGFKFETLVDVLIVQLDLDQYVG